MGYEFRTGVLPEMPAKQQTSTEPLFYLKGRTIHKAPSVSKPDEGGAQRITCGFPICTVSEWIDPQVVLNIFLEHAS